MKILLISYYFPPCGGAPVQRWLRFLPYLAERGHELTVLCSEGGDYPFLDHQLLDQVPPSVQVIRVPAFGMSALWKRLSGRKSEMPYGSIPHKGSLLGRILIWIRLNLIIPDLRVFWNPAACRAALTELRSRPYDLVITTGPPHSSHLIGLKLSRKTNIRWYADFRDPWSEIHYLQLNPPGKLAMMLQRHLEKKVLASADLNLVVSDAIADALPLGPKLVILNGYEPKDFAGLNHQPQPRFTIKYIGQITAGQDIGIFIELLTGLKRDFSLEMIGTNLDQEDESRLRELCQERLQIKEFLPHSEAIKEMVDSDLLLLIVNKLEKNQGILTTKLFEYLASRSPILCFAPPDSAAAQIIKASAAGRCFDYHQVAEARAWIQELASGERRKGNISAYSVASQIDKLDSGLSGKIIIDK